MEGLYSNSSNSKIPRLRSSLNASSSMDNLSVSVGRGHHGIYHENIGFGESPLLRYLRAGSPDSFKKSPFLPLENLEMARSPAVYTTPVKVEDVLVMDGVLIGSAIPAGRFVRSVTDSVGSTTSSSSSSSGGKSTLYKTDICRSWENSGSCRFASKCQFAHGKEELRPTRFPAKNKSETYNKSSIGKGCGTPGQKSRFVQVTAAAGSEAAVATATATATVTARASQIPSPTQPEDTSKNPTTCITISETWSPQDDDIEVVLPNSSTEKPPSRKDVNAYIDSVLYGSTSKKRLPVFAEICSD